jgi:hypothetical protein
MKLSTESRLAAAAGGAKISPVNNADSNKDKKKLEKTSEIFLRTLLFSNKDRTPIFDI